jgi:hypothetical protein
MGPTHPNVKVAASQHLADLIAELDGQGGMAMGEGYSVSLGSQLHLQAGSAEEALWRRWSNRVSA